LSKTAPPGAWHHVYRFVRCTHRPNFSALSSVQSHVDPIAECIAVSEIGLISCFSLRFSSCKTASPGRFAHLLFDSKY
jgi:hypothetical protein